MLMPPKDSGHSQYRRPREKYAVGWPSVMTMMCWLLLGCAASSSRGQAQPVLQVGERVAHVPARLGQVAQLELDGAREEADDARSSRAGSVARIRLSIAIATFLAAAKRPSQLIDQLMSSSSTVEVVVVWSAS